MTEKQKIFYKKHNKMWVKIAERISTAKCVVNIPLLKWQYVLDNEDYDILSSCYACEYCLCNCDNCLLMWGKAQKTCMDYNSIYRQCLISDSWQEQHTLAIQIANLPIRNSESEV